MPPKSSPLQNGKVDGQFQLKIARPRIPSTFLLVSLAPVASWLILRALLSSSVALPALYISLAFSIIAAVSVIWLTPRLGRAFVLAGLKGKDLLKDRDEVVPESLGLLCASVYILLLILFIPFLFTDFSEGRTNKGSLEGLAAASHEFPHQQLAVYLAAVLSMLIATLLGFLDDVFDIRWRHKLPIPILASIPLLMVYYAEGGITKIVVPIPFRPIFGTILELGPLYYVYMSMLSTFATNSINILAGINAVEVSQALIIALSVFLNDMLYLPWTFSVTLQYELPFMRSGQKLTIGGVYDAGLAHGSKELVDRHLLSAYFMLPLIGVCLGFLYHNWYPARVFPGDTLCYLSGMAFAVVGILGHFSKTLLLFFIPQVFNFVLSCPQLFGLVPCPRHRVPIPDHTTRLLHPSYAKFEQRPPSRLTSLILKTFAIFRLVRITTDNRGTITSTTNLTILNVLLVVFGPMTEPTLVKLVVAAQVSGSILAFVVRYGLAGLVYDGDRR